MVALGHFSLCLAWLFTLAGIFFGCYAGLSKKQSCFLALRNLCIICAVLMILSLAGLAAAFLTDDYTNQYVWQHSNMTMSDLYKFTAIWGGMDGSMLLWAAVLTVNVGIVAALYRKNHQLMSWVLTTLLTCQLFFVTVVVFLTNPFRHLLVDFIPPDGNGLNPLLQNPYMAIHPPTLYLGFTTLAVPYAFCMGALLSGQLSSEWIRMTRRWTLVAWGFLTAGIVLGGHWAYLELGWGGFWAWDPVENASFFPWLTGTAFLHSVMIQQRKGMLKIWNVWLVVLTFTLTVFGTFLTRSGVVQSVHAFAKTDIGWVFLTYIAFVFVATLALTYYRRAGLRSERKIESMFSREAAFLLNNLVLLSICFATIWGVLFPVLSEYVTGEKQAVGIPFFNAVNVPLFLVLLFLMAVGPLIAWRKATFANVRSVFLWPFVIAFATGVLLLFAGIDSFKATLAYGLSWFAVLTVLFDFARGYRKQKTGEGGSTSRIARSTYLIKRHRTRYAGYFVHIGVAVMAISITASMTHKVEKEFVLAPGETFMIGPFSLTLDNMQELSRKNYGALAANVSVRNRKTQTLQTVLVPELRQYFRNGESTTEVALMMGALQDVYLILAGTDETGKRAAFKVFLNPLQVWLWVGTCIVLLGTVLALLPESHRRLSPKDFT
jgi:cytochrome c-type biogenesis protein CcmF